MQTIVPICPEFFKDVMNAPVSRRRSMLERLGASIIDENLQEDPENLQENLQDENPKN